jgi:hypothetical protein
MSAGLSLASLLLLLVLLLLLLLLARKSWRAACGTNAKIRWQA